MLKIFNLSYGYTDRPLYKGVSFRVSKGQKVGLVGPNGAGKSTLLSLILGKTQVSEGKIEFSGTVSYVPQEVGYDETLENAKDIREYIDPKNNYEDWELIQFCSSLELEIPLSSSPKKCSGGQKTKLALARALLSKPDLLLLDEPTNFMDIAGKNWVMNFLSEFEGAVIVISHDLSLMDNAIDKILSVNPGAQSIDEYTGNYSQYLVLKKEKEDLLRRQIIVKQKHIKQMEEGLKKMARFTSKKGVRAKIRQKRRIEKEKEALPEMPKEIGKISIKLPEPLPVGELPIRALNLKKSFGTHNVLQDVSLTLHRGECIALIGPNGVGKSTFIKILMGILIPDEGTVAKDERLSVGYYSQEFETFDLTRKVIDVFTEETRTTENFARGFLGRYLLSGDKVFQRIETLSGGEKTRLSIAILTAQNHNLLVLDEPTTYLDVLSQRIILESLKEYKGAMLIVSHTPEFLIELAPSFAYLFPEEKLQFWDESLVSKVEEM